MNKDAKSQLSQNKKPLKLSKEVVRAFVTKTGVRTGLADTDAQSKWLLSCGCIP